MTLTIHLHPNSEAALRAKAAAIGMDVESCVRATIEEKLSEPSGQERMVSDSDCVFSQTLQEIIRLHSSSAQNVDDYREAIYEGRGE